MITPNWFIPHVIDKIGDRRQITYDLVDVTGTVSPELRAFVSTRLAWLDQLTGLSFSESTDPFLRFYHAARLGTLIERQQAALTAQLDEMEAS